MRINWLVGIFMALLLVGASACGGADGDGGDASGGAEAQQEQREKETDPSAPKPDLDGVPEVVAEVNGQEIPRDQFVQAYESQFQQAAMQAQSSAQEVDQDQLKKQVAENLVNTELLVQEADERDIKVSDEEVDQTLQKLAAQNGLESADAFVAAMEQQGMDRDEVESQMQTQVRIERLVSSEAGDVSASEAELRALYDKLVAQQEQAGEQAGAQASQQVPPFAKVRSQLEDQVKAEKESEVAQRLITELREKADVVVNV